MLEPHAAAGIALAAAAATVGGLCSAVVRRKPHGVRSEKELIAAARVVGAVLSPT
jgi:hypothetical protein